MNDNLLSNREKLGSRLGFLLLAAGCAIGVGNVWRFPYIAGQFGGAFFVLIYLFFLLILGYPVMMIELAIGRAGQANVVGSMKKLQPNSSGKLFPALANVVFLGNIVLMMFYTVVTGWMLNYAWKFMKGDFASVPEDQVGEVFGKMLGNPQVMLLFVAIVLAFTLFTCIGGVSKGVERVTKYMMMILLLLMFIMVGVAVIQPGGLEGVKFFLKPNVNTLSEHGFWAAVHAAMAQAFFTLSLGVGSIAIFGSYISKEKSLSNESLVIIGLDTLVAMCAGVIIFACCFAYKVEPNAGPALVFITLPHIFQNMSHGMLWGSIFFLFMSFAALTTVVAVAENIIAYGIDELKISRVKSSLLVCIILFIGAIPCILGFNVWSGFTPFGGGSCVLDLEDFIVSDNLLPLGALLMVLFSTHKFGWGVEKLYQEINTGSGVKISPLTFFYVKWILPVLIFAVWAIGIAKKFI